MSMTGLPANGRSTIYDEKGRTVIPKNVREKLGLKKGDTLEFVADGDMIVAYESED